MASVRDLLRFLQRHGYLKVRQTGSHIILEHATRRMVVVPNHRGDVPRGLLIRILKDGGFTWEDFLKS
ncbi:MAG TPA: type II toxin-antitoxin system HicA family toxin [Candidatus Binatia bacterium]|nr:type II toxin-antitoxin system HicA family toxin [Candidatus Binatia bacterium]